METNIVVGSKVKVLGLTTIIEKIDGEKYLFRDEKDILWWEELNVIELIN